MHWGTGQRSVGDFLISCPSKYGSQQRANLHSLSSSIFLYHFGRRGTCRRSSHTSPRYVLCFTGSTLGFKEASDQSMTDVMVTNWKIIS